MSKPQKHYGKWRVRWVNEHGVRHSAVFDDHRVASHELRQRELEVEERRRGQHPTSDGSKTFEDAAAYWETHRAPHKRSCDDDASILKQLRRGFGALPLSDISGWVVAVDRYVATKATLSPKTVANHLTLLGSILRAAYDLMWMPRVPKIRKPRVRLIGHGYRYLRNDDEIARFLNAADVEGDVVGMLYRTAVYTGMRAGELAALEWQDVDLERRLITVHRSFDGPTKADDVRYVPILDALLESLGGWRARSRTAHVFVNRDGGMLQPSARVFQEVLHRVLARAGFPPNERGGRTVHHVRFHDLRHTFASQWVLKGGDLFKLQKILGHKTVQMTMRYAHLQPAAFREDYGRFTTIVSCAAPAAPRTAASSITSRRRPALPPTG